MRTSLLATLLVTLSAPLLVGCQEADGFCQSDGDCADEYYCDVGLCRVRAEGVIALPEDFGFVDTSGLRWSQLRPQTTADSAALWCQTAGGRLPSIGEWDRLEMSPPQTMWTAVRLSGGTTMAFGETAEPVIPENNAQFAYRCVYPKADESFGSRLCQSEAGAGCRVVGSWQLDSSNRPAMTHGQARAECQIVGARLPTVAEVQRMMHGVVEGVGSVDDSSRLPTGDHSLWTGDLSPTADGMEAATWRYSGATNRLWAYHAGQTEDGSPPTGDMAPTNAIRPFRCIAGPPRVPTAWCEDACETVQIGERPLRVETSLRPALPWGVASRVCRAFAGALPDAAELLEYASTHGLSDDPEWTTSPTSKNGAREFVTLLGVGVGGSASASVPRPFRCIYLDESAHPIPWCPEFHHAVWENAAWTCRPWLTGNACLEGPCHGEGGSTVDNWGNVWDSTDRGERPYGAARMLCRDEGGRLPTATELHRVRGFYWSDFNPPVPYSETPLWTLTPHGLRDYQVTFQLNDGPDYNSVVGRAHRSVEQAYRCIWPVERPEQFGGTALAANANEIGLVLAGFTMDWYDRPALPQASAAWECAFYGATLPTARDFRILSDFTNEPLQSWLAHPTLDSSGAPTMAYALGLPPWDWSAAGNETRSVWDPAPFRCVLRHGSFASL